MRHIVVVNDYGFVNGGASKIAIFTAIELAKRGEDVSFFCSVGPVCDELASSKVRTICLNQNDINNKSRLKVLLEGTNNKQAKREFETLIKGFNNDLVIVHIHSWTKALSSSIFKLMKNFKNVSAVVTLHDYFSVCPNGGLYDYKHKKICTIKSDFRCCFCNCDKRNYAQKVFRYYRFVRQKSDMKWIHNYIYISDLNKKVFLEKRHGDDKMFYVRNFIEMPSSMVWNQSENHDFYLYVGRVSEEKGVDVFCEAVSSLNENGVVIGDGPIKEELEKAYPSIHFIGWQGQTVINEYVKKAKAFVFCSKWYEGAPLVVVEMLLRGIPCIISDKSSAVEYARDYGGCTIYDGSLDDLKCKMQADAAFPPLKINRLNFSMDRYCCDILNVYESISS